MATNIVLLDIPSRTGFPASPNTWKVRLALNYKRLSYRTQWVPSPDIERICKALGIKPTSVKPDGSPLYTLPAIIDKTDPSKPVFLSDSMPIVEYLERIYPPSPSLELIPSDRKAFQVVFMQFVMPKLFGAIVDLSISRVAELKCQEDQVDFRARMEARFKKPFESIEKQGAEREAAFKLLEQTLATLSIAFDQKNGHDFLGGRYASFADLALAAWLLNQKTLSPNDVWVRITGMDGGRWKAYLELFQDWIAVK